MAPDFAIKKGKKKLAWALVSCKLALFLLTEETKK
jgi:hypothetical protein